MPVRPALPRRLQRIGRDGPRPHRLARTRIAITQVHYHPDARAYLQRRKEAGSTSTEAIRARRRRLSDVVYRARRNDAHIGTHQDSFRHQLIDVGARGRNAAPREDAGARTVAKMPGKPVNATLKG